MKKTRYEERISNLLKDMPLSSPPADFTLSVMERITREEPVKLKKHAGFTIYIYWIAAAIIPAVVIFSNSIFSFINRGYNALAVANLAVYQWAGGLAETFSNISFPNNIFTITAACSILLSIYLITYIKDAVKD
jgi:hypothetical protein